MKDQRRTGRSGSAESTVGGQRESLLGGLAGLLRDEAIDHVVSTASGGWLSYDGEDEEVAPPKKPTDSFNDRVERALAEMRAQQQSPPFTSVEAVPPIIPVRHAPAAAVEVAAGLADRGERPRPTGGVRSFGRKTI